MATEDGRAKAHRFHRLRFLSSETRVALSSETDESGVDSGWICMSVSRQPTLNSVRSRYYLPGRYLPPATSSGCTQGIFIFFSIKPWGPRVAPSYRAGHI